MESNFRCPDNTITSLDCSFFCVQASKVPIARYWDARIIHHAPKAGLNILAGQLKYWCNVGAKRKLDNREEGRVCELFKVELHISTFDTSVHKLTQSVKKGSKNVTFLSLDRTVRTLLSRLEINGMFELSCQKNQLLQDACWAVEKKAKIGDERSICSN